MTTYTMSTKELTRVEVFQRLVCKEITQVHAANLLALSTRQIRRLLPRFQVSGPQGLIHGNRGKPGNHCLPTGERTRIITLLRTQYPDFGPTFAAEKLAEHHGITRDPKTIRALLIAEKLWQPAHRRAAQEHRQWRQRKAAFGEMMQFDGSYEHWFEERGSRCCLLAAIDDATGTIPHAQFVAHEGVVPVFSFWQAYTARYGVPRSIYLDRFSTYQMTQKVAVENHDLKTQFQRAMEELRCEPIFAHSPQAKGRVERLFKTLQDRLVKELRLAGVTTIEEGNWFLRDVFLPTFNKRFAVMPATAANLHRPLTIGERGRLPSIFARQEARTVRNDWTVSFRKGWYQLTRQQPVTVCKGATVTVEERLDGTIRFRLRGRYLNTHPLPARPCRTGRVPWVLAATASAPS